MSEVTDAWSQGKKAQTMVRRSKTFKRKSRKITILKGQALVAALQRKFRCDNPNQLRKHIGWTGTRIRSVEERNKRITPLQIANLVARTAKKSKSSPFFRALIEFRPVDRFQKRKKGQYYIVNYVRHSELRDMLDSERGIYVFFNSEGKVLYVGRALRRSLWKEVNSCYRAKRQMAIFKAITSSTGKMARIKKRSVYFHEIAHYVSCYAVEQSQITNLEALLIRCMANNVFNVRMERFSEV